MPVKLLQLIPDRERCAELLRFAVTGSLCASFNVVVATFLNSYVGLHYLLSLAICFATVTFLGFVLNRSWTFRKQGGGAWLEFLRYVTVAALHMVAGLLLCRHLVDARGLPYALSIAVVAVALAPLTYLAHRCWSFGLALLAARSGARPPPPDTSRDLAAASRAG